MQDATGHKADGQSARHQWYYGAVGFVAAAAIFAVSCFPLQFVGLVGIVTVAAMGLIDRRARRLFDTRPRHLGAVLYFVFGSVVFLGSLALAATVAHRTDGPWLGGILAALVFGVFLGAAWVPDQPRSRGSWEDGG